MTWQVGDLYSFGSTEEALEKTILSLPARGLLQDPPLDHATGHGRVAYSAGDYLRSSKRVSI